jgi:hypothetical protein
MHFTPSERSLARESPDTETPSAIVFERRPRWAPELERQFTGQNVRVIACRSLGDVQERSVGLACGVILLDLTGHTTECLRFLGRRLAEPNALPVVAIASEETADLEWPVRELGAIAFFVRRIPGHEMANLCRRQWAGKSNGTKA